MLNSRKGFTLPEILLIGVSIALIIGVALPRFYALVKSGRLAANLPPIAVVSVIDRKSGEERSWNVRKFLIQTNQSVTFETTSGRRVTLRGPNVIEE